MVPVTDEPMARRPPAPRPLRARASTARIADRSRDSASPPCFDLHGDGGASGPSRPVEPAPGVTKGVAPENMEAHSSSRSSLSLCCSCWPCCTLLARFLSSHWRLARPPLEVFLDGSGEAGTVAGDCDAAWKALAMALMLDQLWCMRVRDAL